MTKYLNKIYQILKIIKIGEEIDIPNLFYKKIN